MLNQRWWKFNDLTDGEALEYSVKDLVFNALREIYEGNGGSILNAGLFEATYHNLLGAIETGYGSVQYGMPDFEFVRKLQNSAKFFAARKTALQVTQLTALTTNPESGTKRSWSDFKKLAKGVVGNYNDKWLKTEYNTAIRTARSGSQWQTFVKDADLFPNLEYFHTVSANPRPEHEKHVGIIRPVNDRFWDTHLPPIGWNCKCSVRNTRKDSTNIPDDIATTDPVEAALQNNPAKTGELFNVSATTYARETVHIPDETLARELKTRVFPNLDFTTNVYENPNGGRLDVHPSVDELDFERNVPVGFRLAKLGEKVDLQGIRKFNEKGGFNPDAVINGVETDFKHSETDKKSSLIRNIKEKSEQAPVVVLVLNNPIDRQTLNSVLRGAYIQDGKHGLEERTDVWVLYPDNHLSKFTREEILNNTHWAKMRRP